MGLSLASVITAIYSKGVIKVGTNDNDRIFGDDLFEPTDTSRVNDILFGRGGDDFLSGILGDDLIFGGRGNDLIFGGQGNDILRGGLGADTFSFIPSLVEGKDVIMDFRENQGDKISFDIGNILRANPTIFANSGDPDKFELSDLDADADWSLGADKKGNLIIYHPSGEIKVRKFAFDEDHDTFEELSDILEFTFFSSNTGSTTSGDDTITGTDRSDVLYGEDGNDILLAGLGQDTVIGGSGDDFLAGETGNDNLTGGTGEDEFFFDPSNISEGNDVILDFEIGTDVISLNIDDVLDSTPGIAAASGDTNVLEASDFDAVAEWTLGASDEGNVVVTHPNGTIELAGIAFSDSVDTFEEIAALGLLQFNETV